MKHVWIIATLLMALVVFACSGCGKEQPSSQKTTATAEPPITEPAPPPPSTTSSDLQKAADFTLTSIDGQTVKLSDYRGKVIILDFWATWCPPCRMEIPHFNELVELYGERGLVVLGVSMDRGGANVVKQFKQDNLVNYPVAMDDGATSERYQQYLPSQEQGGIPFTFVIDRNGNIREQYVGYREKPVFEAAITPLF